VTGLPARVASVMLEQPTCLLCIALQAGIDQLAVVRSMERISETARITAIDHERCGKCGSSVAPVYSLRWR
jgi:hypothetical protein